MELRPPLLSLKIANNRTWYHWAVTGKQLSPIHVHIWYIQYTVATLYMYVHKSPQQIRMCNLHVLKNQTQHYLPHFIKNKILSRAHAQTMWPLYLAIFFSKSRQTVPCL